MSRTSEMDHAQTTIKDLQAVVNHLVADHENITSVISSITSTSAMTILDYRELQGHVAPAKQQYNVA